MKALEDIKIQFKKLRVLIVLNWVRYCKYPKSILPKHNYFQNFVINNNDFREDFYVVRRSALSKSETFDENGFLITRALIEKDKEILGLSMNLLGSFFKEKHICFIPKNPASKYWEKESDRDLKKQFLKEYYKYIQLVDGCPIFFKIDDINAVSFPYHRELDSHFKKLIKHLPIENMDKKDGKYLALTGKSIILHKPTKTNYWHVEYHIDQQISTETTTVKDLKNKSYDSSTPEYQKHYSDQLVSHSLNLLVSNAKNSIYGKKCNKVPANLYS